MTIQDMDKEEKDTISRVVVGTEEINNRAEGIMTGPEAKVVDTEEISNRAEGTMTGPEAKVVDTKINSKWEEEEEEEEEEWAADTEIKIMT